MNDALAHVGARKDLVALMHMGRFRPAVMGESSSSASPETTQPSTEIFSPVCSTTMSRGLTAVTGTSTSTSPARIKVFLAVRSRMAEMDLRERSETQALRVSCAALDPQDFQGGEGLTGKRGRGAASRQEAFQCKTLFPHVAQRLAHNRHGGQQRNDAQRGQGGFGHGGFQQHLTHKDIGHDAGKRKKSHQLSAHTCSRRLGRSAGATARARSRGPTIRLPRCGKGLQNGFGTGLRRLVGQHYGGAGRVDAHRLHPSQGPAYFSHLLRLRGRGYAQTQATFHGVSQKNFDRSGVVSHSFFHVLWQPRSKTPLC